MQNYWIFNLRYWNAQKPKKRNMCCTVGFILLFIAPALWRHSFNINKIYDMKLNFFILYFFLIQEPAKQDLTIQDIQELQQGNLTVVCNKILPDRFIQCSKSCDFTNLTSYRIKW